MAYCTYTSILTILPGLPQTTTAEGWTETSSVISSHIVRSDSIINSKIARRYSVPFTSTPPLVQTISEDLTAYFTYRSFYTQDNMNKSDYFAELREEAMKLLEQIKDGDMDLVDSTGAVIGEKTGTASIIDSTTRSYHSTFDIDPIDEATFDSDRLEAVRDAR